MAFRLGLPGMTPERCRACKVNGGATVATDEEARAVKEAVLAHPEVWAELGMEPDPAVRVGDELALEPCVDVAYYQRRRGRECPRVELLPRNGVAAGLLFGALNGDAGPLFPLYVEAVTADMLPEEAQATIVRAYRSLQSRPVRDWRAAQIRRASEGEKP